MKLNGTSIKSVFLGATQVASSFLGADGVGAASSAGPGFVPSAPEVPTSGVYLDGGENQWTDENGNFLYS
jgi:hypothetical protein